MPERAPVLPWHVGGAAYASLAPTWQRSVDRYGLVPRASRRRLRALDAGCGTGYGAELLSGKGYDVTAFDKWPGFALYAKYRRIDFVESSFGDFQMSGFDVVCCFEVIEHLDISPEEAARLLASWVKQSGTVYVSVPLNHPDTKWHTHVFADAASVCRILESCFNVHVYHKELSAWTLQPLARGESGL